MGVQGSRDRVRAHRAALRAAGLRPIQIWVPDTRSPAFLAEAARQSRLVASNPDPAVEAFMDWANAALLASLPEEPEGPIDDGKR